MARFQALRLFKKARGRSLDAAQGGFQKIIQDSAPCFLLMDFGMCDKLYQDDLRVFSMHIQETGFSERRKKQKAGPILEAVVIPWDLREIAQHLSIVLRTSLQDVMHRCLVSALRGTRVSLLDILSKKRKKMTREAWSEVSPFDKLAPFRIRGEEYQAIEHLAHAFVMSTGDVIRSCLRASLKGKEQAVIDRLAFEQEWRF